MQQGSVIQSSRKGGPDVWQFRWSEKDLNGHRVYRKRVIGTVDEFRDETAVRQATSGLLSDVNLRFRQARIGFVTIDQLCEHLEQREMRSGASLWSVATQDEIKAVEVEAWLRSLDLCAWFAGQDPQRSFAFPVPPTRLFRE